MINIWTLKRAGTIWGVLLVLAWLNGALREFVLSRFWPEPAAHLISATTGVLLMSAAVGLLWKKSGIVSKTEAAAIGAIWIGLTICFETFLLGRLFSQHSWKQIFAAYDISRGELWPVVLLWIGMLPLYMLGLRGPAPKSPLSLEQLRSTSRPL
jgi:hypothetical protein